MNVVYSEEPPQARLIYLLGAGASYPALPLAQDVPSEMLAWGVKIDEEESVYADSQARGSIKKMAAELKRWGHAAKQHYSVDTLAKKLFLLRQSNELWQLKATLSAFFMLRQSLSPAARRYDSFFAALLEGPAYPPAFPKTVGILTWNYDRQLERAYHQYCPDWRRVQEVITFSSQLVRPNGLLGRAIDKGTGEEYNLNFESGKLEVYEFVSQEFEALLTHFPTMRFAFEPNGGELEKFRRLAGKADTLVVIGYSFPFFNRQEDRSILEALPAVRRVFIQVLPQDAKAVEARMRSLRDFPQMQFIEDQALFFVPHDF